MNGSLALIGSGEYLPAMAAFEKSLLDDAIALGKAPTYIQIPTAAGKESSDRLDYWKELGAAQAQRIGVNSIHLPIYSREDIRVIPHFNKFFRWIPESAAKVLLHVPSDAILIGVDEMTAIVKRAGAEHWVVVGDAKVHILKGLPDQVLHDGQEIDLTISSQ